MNVFPRSHNRSRPQICERVSAHQEKLSQKGNNRYLLKVMRTSTRASWQFADNLKLYPNRPRLRAHTEVLSSQYGEVSQKVLRDNCETRGTGCHQKGKYVSWFSTGLVQWGQTPTPQPPCTCVRVLFWLRSVSSLLRRVCWGMVPKVSSAISQWRDQRVLDSLVVMRTNCFLILLIFSKEHPTQKWNWNQGPLRFTTKKQFGLNFQYAPRNEMIAYTKIAIFL